MQTLSHNMLIKNVCKETALHQERHPLRALDHWVVCVLCPVVAQELPNPSVLEGSLCPVPWWLGSGDPPAGVDSGVGTHTVVWVTLTPAEFLKYWPVAEQGILPPAAGARLRHISAAFSLLWFSCLEMLCGYHISFYLWTLTFDLLYILFGLF